MTSLQKVYDAFLVKMLDDEYVEWDDDELAEDWRGLLDSALPWFKFPRVSLEISGDAFVDDLSNNEIQILATYMKCEWLNRNLLTWESVKPLYEERDFSQANLIDKWRKSLEAEQKHVAKLESNYYRSRNGKPFDYTGLARQA